MINAEKSAPEVREEEMEQLLRHYKETGDADARDEIILFYGRLVKRIVRRMIPKYSSHNEYEDLVNCGIIGLIDAVEKFDFRHGVKFETYAVSRVRGEILDYMRAQDWAPSSLRKKISAITAAYDQLESQGGKPPDEQAVAAMVDLPVAQLRKIMSQTHVFNVINFEDVLTTCHAMGEIASPSGETPENKLLDKELRSILAEMIEELPEKERLVITLYYYEELMIKEIAEILSVSESRVSQIHSKVLAKMRVRLQSTLR